MTKRTIITPDLKLDLVLERTIEIPPAKVWKAWTTPELMKEWFCPSPWKTIRCDIDLRPGGKFNTTMQGPNGETHSADGCYLEIVENERLIWTDALSAGYRPSSKPNDCFNSFFTAALLLEPHGTGTKYTAVGIHSDEAARKKHEEMGFHEGWGKALDQLIALMKNK